MCHIFCPGFQLKNSTRTAAEAAVCRCSSKSVFLKLFTGKHLCWNLFFNKVAGRRAATLFKKDSNTGVFLRYCEIFKKSFFYRTPLVAASTPDVIQMYLCDIYIMLSIYKSNMTVMSLQRKKNADIWCPCRCNVEITFNKQCFSDFKFQI